MSNRLWPYVLVTIIYVIGLSIVFSYLGKTSQEDMRFRVIRIAKCKNVNQLKDYLNYKQIRAKKIFESKACKEDLDRFCEGKNFTIGYKDGYNYRK